jgi:uncharacterized protein DUF1353
MNITLISISGDFQSVPDPSDPTDSTHRVLLNDIGLDWWWREHNADPWRHERLDFYAGTRWDGASRPWLVGWLIKRWGLFSPATLPHDICFGSRPRLSDGTRITRQHVDLLFLGIMQWLSATKGTSWDLTLAKVMFRVVRLFGAGTWNKHDAEFRQ